MEINKIYNGDCLEVMADFPDKHFDLVLTDPPYGIDIGSMNFTKSTIGGVTARKDYRGMAEPSKIFRFLWSGMLQQDMKNKEKRHHPTQKPTELFKWILEKYTEEGMKILDPFLGSGTTAIACKQLKRNYVGIEISPDYCKIAQDRLNALGEPLF